MPPMLLLSYISLAGMICLVIWLINKIQNLKLKVKSLNSKESSMINTEEVKSIQYNEEKHAEMQRLSIVAKQTDNAIMIMDREGNIQWLNDGFTRMYEYTYEQFVQIRGSNILQTSFNPMVQKCIEQCLETQKPSYYEAINITPSGRKIWTHTSLSPVLNDSGEIIHLVTIDSDISTRKEAGDSLIKRVDIITHKIADLSKQQQDMMLYTESLMEEVGRSNEKIKETDQIVSYIQDMSDKIKIMGINASIEAQYVGDKGSGFKVISNEIVQMSDTTKHYSREISNIVKHIQESSKQLNNGRELVEHAAQKYQKAVEELKYEVNLVESVVDRLN